MTFFPDGLQVHSEHCVWGLHVMMAVITVGEQEVPDLADTWPVTGRQGRMLLLFYLRQVRLEEDVLWFLTSV